MSKIFSGTMAMVVATVMIDPRIIGTMIPVKTWRSLAPSRRAASRSSPGTPLIAADRTTIANPVWSQTRIRISQKMLMGLAGGLPGVHEAPDDRRADERDRQRQEDDRLGKRLAPDAIE